MKKILLLFTIELISICLFANLPNGNQPDDKNNTAVIAENVADVDVAKSDAGIAEEKDYISEKDNSVIEKRAASVDGKRSDVNISEDEDSAKKTNDDISITLSRTVLCWLFIGIIAIIIFFYLFRKRKRIMSVGGKILKLLKEEMSDNQDEKGPGPETEKGSGPEIESGSGSEIESGSGSETESGSGPETGSGPGPETGSGPETESKNYSFAQDTGEWIVVGASVQGSGHISMNLPCQDSSSYKYIGDGWGIAIVADGAGSAKHSQVGSSIAVQRGLFHFEKLISANNWMQSNQLPTDIQWNKNSYQTLKVLHDEIKKFSEQKNVDYKSLSSTIIVVIHAPKGLLVCHIGDGRAGYRDSQGEWHSIITPHKGEEANQTIFIPSDFWDVPYFELSGVLVPEARVITAPITAFTLMSDGCEKTSWECNLFNAETQKYYDPNLPSKRFFNSVVDSLKEFRNNNVSLDEMSKKWEIFLCGGNNSFKKESDDKSMIVGTLYK